MSKASQMSCPGIVVLSDFYILKLFGGKGDRIVCHMTLKSCCDQFHKNKYISFCVRACVGTLVSSLTAFYTRCDARALRFHGNGSCALIHTVAEEFFNVGFFTLCRVRNCGEKKFYVLHVSTLSHTHARAAH